MHFVDSSEGMALWMEAQKLEKTRTGKENSRALLDKISSLLMFARQKLLSALLRYQKHYTSLPKREISSQTQNSIPDSPYTLLCLARVEHWLALNWQGNEDARNATFHSAQEYYFQV